MLMSPEAQEKQKAEQRAIEEAKAQCDAELRKMKNATIEEVEHIKQHLTDLMKRCQKLPFDFKQKLQMSAKTYECAAYMRDTDDCLRQAVAKAQARQFVERGQCLARGKQSYRKALMLGADKEFAIAAERMIENIMLTSSPDTHRPTKAKPMDTAPKNPHCAKMPGPSDQQIAGRKPGLFGRLLGSKA